MIKHKTNNANLSMHPVIVDWIDSVGASGWHRPEHSDMNCCSVGSLISKTKKSILLSQSKDSRDMVNNVIEIPIAAILRIRKLKL